MTTQALFDYNTLMQQMLATNAQYLIISVTVILAFYAIGNIFNYFVNVRPLKEQLTEDKEKIEELSNENRKLLTEVEELKRQLEDDVETFKKSTKAANVRMQNRFAEIQGDLESLADSTEHRINESLDSIKRDVHFNEWFRKYDNSQLWDAINQPTRALDSLLDSFESTDKEYLRVAKNLNLTSIKHLIQSNKEYFAQNETDKEKLLSLLRRLDKEDADGRLEENIESFKNTLREIGVVM